VNRHLPGLEITFVLVQLPAAPVLVSDLSSLLTGSRVVACLWAVAVHLGTDGAGHVVAYVREPLSPASWLLLDDNEAARCVALQHPQRTGSGNVPREAQQNCVCLVVRHWESQASPDAEMAGCLDQMIRAAEREQLAKLTPCNRQNTHRKTQPEKVQDNQASIRRDPLSRMQEPSHDTGLASRRSSLRCR
jgi:hypothetical protein